MSEPEPEEGERAELRLTREQQALLLEWTDWRVRMTRRLVRRFGRWVKPEEIEGKVLVTTTECACRFDPSRGVPFGGYALTAVVRVVGHAARQAGWRAEKAYQAASGCGEMWLSSPRAIFGTEEERRGLVDKLAGEAATAIVLAGAFSRDTAAGDEDAFVSTLDRPRIVDRVGRMSARNQKVLEMRYGVEPQTLEAIAKELGCAPVTVRRAHEEAMGELRELFA